MATIYTLAQWQKERLPTLQKMYSPKELSDIAALQHQLTEKYREIYPADKVAAIRLCETGQLWGSKFFGIFNENGCRRGSYRMYDHCFRRWLYGGQMPFFSSRAIFRQGTMPAITG